MAKFLLSFSSGIKDRIVEVEHGIEDFFVREYGHINEYLKLGGKPAQLIAEPEPTPEPVAVEEVHVEPSSGSAEPVEEPVAAAGAGEHGAAEVGPV